MGACREHEQLLARVSATVLIGCLGGICLAVAHFFLQAIWAPVLDYDYTLSSLYQFQVIGSFAIILWTLGVIAADVIPSGKNNRLDPVLIGLLSGICTALVFTSIIVVHDIVSHPPVFFYAGDPLLIRGFLDRFFHPWRIPLAGFILVSGIIQAIGAWYRKFRQKQEPEGNNILHKPAITKMLYRHRVVLLTLLAALIIPPGLMYIAMDRGVSEGQSACCDVISDTVDVTRSGSDSIRIVMKPDLKVKHDPVPSVNIYLDEKDVSNQSVITRSRLDVVITPPEGLLFQRDASVSLQGRGVLGNETVPIHLQIIATYPDKGIRYMICDRGI